MKLLDSNALSRTRFYLMIRGFQRHNWRPVLKFTCHCNFRLMLNNIPHIKAYRMNLGDEISELALQFGADDIDGTVQKESIMHLAGSTAPLDHDKVQLAKIVSNSGSIPIQRNTTYTSFVEFIPPTVPERRSLRMATGD